jgi:hypothetical protein
LANAYPWIQDKGKLGKAHVCRLHDELHAFGPQLSDCCLKVINGQANMITHPSVNLWRNGERQPVQL